MWIPNVLMISCSVYLIAVFVFVGMRFSISDTHYGWIEKKKIQWPFPVFMTFLSIMLWAFVLKFPISSPGKELFIGAGFSAFAIGAAALFRQNWFVNFNHNLFSVLLIALCFLGFGFAMNWYGLVFYALVVGVLMLWDKINNKTFWIETAAIIVLLFLMRHYITQIKLGL